MTHRPQRVSIEGLLEAYLMGIRPYMGPTGVYYRIECEKGL
jgi:hypothetical protein